MTSTRAFTLVELMVSIALGMVIVFTAYAGVRVAAKSIVVSRNLARENRVIAEGYFQGMIEADFWYAEDDPYDVNGQPQRKLYDTWGNVSAAANVGKDNVYGQPFAEMDLPDEYWNYNISDNRTWSRQGLMKSTTFFWNTTGSYAQIGCIDHADEESAWQHVVQDRMYSSLGWTGLLDYLPSPQPVCYYLAAPDASGNTINSYGSPVVPFVYGWGMPAYSAKFWESMCHDATWNNARQPAEKALSRSGVHLYGITSAYGPREGWTFNGAAAAYVSVGQRAIVGGIANGLYATVPHASLTAPGWPELQIKVLRTFDAEVSARLGMTVTVTNPSTGLSHELTFVPVCTSLRGARQQRQWAHWGAAVMDR
jgi:hypothetical protein